MKSLNKILVALARAVPGVLNAFFVVLLVMCIYAILGVEFFVNFGDHGQYVNHQNETVDYFTPRQYTYGQEYFGNFFRSLFTLFQARPSLMG